MEGISRSAAASEADSGREPCRPGSRPGRAEFYVYIACGNDTSKGTVYQTDNTGRVVATVSLPFTPTGMGLVRNHALALAIPRDGGKILEIDNNGHVSTILERDRSLLHPIRVAVPGDSDTVVVADDISQVLASTTTEGVKPTIYQQFNWQKPNPGMYVAMTRDNHVIFSSDATPGVYRYESQGSASAKKAVLPGFGGVAADPEVAALGGRPDEPRRPAWSTCSTATRCSRRSGCRRTRVSIATAWCRSRPRGTCAWPCRTATRPAARSRS